MRFPGARLVAILAAVFLPILTGPGQLSAQGARETNPPFARGKPLSEWLVQAEHYIPELRREAIRAIAALGPGGVAALPVLVRATRDENEEVRFWAVEAIRRQGPAARAAAPALLVVLADDTRRVQEAARAAMEAIGGSSVPLLLSALGSSDAWLRANAAEALGVIGDAKGPVIPGLVRLLADDSLWVRASAAWALGHLGGDARKAAKPLAQALRGELRQDPTLSESSARVRVLNLVFALGKLGGSASSAVPSVLTVLYDGDDSLRSAAAVALAGIGGKAAAPLGKAIRTGATPVRLEAARALRLMGPAAKPALKDMVKVLETTDELDGGRELVIALAEAVGALGTQGKPALEVLERQHKRSVSADVVAALERALRQVRLGA